MALMDAAGGEPGAAGGEPGAAGGPTDGRKAGREGLRVFAASAVLTTAIVAVGQAVPLIGQNALALVALVFVYLPVVALRRRGLDAADFGLSGVQLRRGLGLGLVLTALTLPGFFVGFHIWERMAFDNHLDVSLDNYLAWPESLMTRPADFQREGLYAWRQQREIHLRWVGGGPWTLDLDSDAALTHRAGPSPEVTEAAGGTTHWHVQSPAGQELVLWARGGHRLSVEPSRQGMPLSGSSVWQGGSFGSDDDPGTLSWSRSLWWIPLGVLVQVLLVAFPEEFFYRGYLQSRLGARWRRRWQWGPLHTSTAIILTSACFAVGHFVVGLDVQRLAVFFPALVFGWLRDRSGGLGGSITYHAACNLMVELTVVHYWPS